MKENYKGYLFHPEQAHHVYNPTLAVYFMQRTIIEKEVPEGDALRDSNVQPSLHVVSNLPWNQSLLDTLITRGIHIQSPIHQSIDSTNALKFIHGNPSIILAFLYYFGLVTFCKLPDGVSGNQLVIPNQVIKREYFDTIEKRLMLSNDDKFAFQVVEFVKRKNISSLCELIKERVLANLNANDVGHTYEQDIKVLVLVIAYISGRNGTCLDSEFQTLHKTSAELVFIPTGDIHIECKNLTTEEVVLSDGRMYEKLHAGGVQRLPYEQLQQHWARRVAIANQIDSLPECQLRDLKLRAASKHFNKYDASSSCNPISTVQDAWDNLVIQTKINNQLLEKQFGKPINSFALMKVGLYTLLYSSV